MRNLLNQPLTKEQNVRLFSTLAQKIHTNMLGDILKKTHDEVSIINPDYLPAQMSDGEYFSLLQHAWGDRKTRQTTIDVIKNLLDANANIDSVFESEQAKKLKKIPPIKHKYIRAFFENELKRPWAHRENVRQPNPPSTQLPKNHLKLQINYVLIKFGKLF